MAGTDLSRNESLFTRFLLKYVFDLLIRPFSKAMRTPEESAGHLIEVCLKSNQTGIYYDGNEIARSSELSHKPELIEDLWKLSEELTQVFLDKT